ncbi:YgdI/YgdR family lipoprotein [Endozoicomonas arenosclerae]|uniref:YgdI/YgdR family lipoprotein n=1 Tax=Endozoicomonas arenosclerae TaxID=1633495 RepID=UPI000781212F|nr:YgdI/YgdR family lipoprotein [Endozoicomonas arenosclerae]
MKSLYLAIISSVILLAGCSSPHVITMKDGRTITTQGSPEMNDDGFYEYETLEGSDAKINGSEVLEINEK